MLLPLSESRLFLFNLLCKTLSKLFLLFSVFRVVDLFDLWLAKLPGLHLSKSICLVVVLLG